MKKLKLFGGGFLALAALGFVLQALGLAPKTETTETPTVAVQSSTTEAKQETSESTEATEASSEKADYNVAEMLVVLLIISILLLLFVPNLSKQKENAKQTGNAVVVKVVEGQAELYELQNEGEASLSRLVETGAITEAQAKAYNEYYAKNTNQSPTVKP